MRRAPFQLNCSAGKHSQNDRMDGKLTCTMQDFFFFLHFRLMMIVTRHSSVRKATVSHACTAKGGIDNRRSLVGVVRT
jgi:hypothetical protein